MTTTAGRRASAEESAGAEARNAEVRNAEARNDGLDAFRAVMTLLVLFHHTAITYGGPGSWYYREIKPDGSATSTLLLLFCAINQAYFMGVFFLLAGYFTPPSLDRKGPLRFLSERLLRLGLPLLIYGFVIGPVTIALARTGEGKPFMETLNALWARGAFEPGPMWFVEALLVFSFGAIVAYALRPASDRRERPFPSNATLAIAALVTGAAAFVIRLWWPVGTNILGLQFGYFASYIVLFVFGCLAAAPRWLEHVPDATMARWRTIMWCALPVLPLFALLGDHVELLRGTADGGWTIPALVYAFWEPLVAWGLILTLLVVFQQHFVQMSRNWRTLAERAYAIYIIHPPVLVAIALQLRGVQAPALIKFVATATLGCLASFYLAGLLRRIPGATRVI